MLKNQRGHRRLDYEGMRRQARAESEEQVKQAIKEIQFQQESARMTLRSSSKKIATQIANQALGRHIA